MDWGKGGWLCMQGVAARALIGVWLPSVANMDLDIGLHIKARLRLRGGRRVRESPFASGKSPLRGDRLIIDSSVPWGLPRLWP